MIYLDGQGNVQDTTQGAPGVMVTLAMPTGDADANAALQVPLQTTARVAGAVDLAAGNYPDGSGEHVSQPFDVTGGGAGAVRTSNAALIIAGLALLIAFLR